MSWVKDLKKKFQFQTSNPTSSLGEQIYGQEDNIIEIEVQIQKLILTQDEVYFFNILVSLEQFYNKDEIQINNLKEFFLVLTDKTNTGLKESQNFLLDKNLVASLHCMMWLSKFLNLEIILITELPTQIFEFKAFMSELKAEDSLVPDIHSYLNSLDQLTTLYLSQLLLKQQFLSDSIKKDYLFRMFEIFFKHPSESLKDLINIVIRHAAQNSLLTYLNQKNLIFLCCEKLKDWVEEEKETDLLWLLQIISNVLEEDVQHTFNLEKQFTVFGGYSLLTKLLLNTMFQWELKYYLISILENLVFSGTHQYDSPSLSLSSENNFGPNITNFNPIAPLLFVLLTPNIDPTKVGLSQSLPGDFTPLPTQIKHRILCILCNLAQLSPNNFNLLNSHLLLLKLIENFSTISFEMKESTIKLLIHAVNNFEYRPTKELSLFYFVIRELENDLESLKLIFNSITQLLNNKSSLAISLEVGLYHNLNELFSQILTRVKLYKDNYPDHQEIDMIKFIDLNTDTPGPMELKTYLKAFPFLCSSISAHLLDDVTILDRFKQNFQDGLLELLRYSITRDPCLMLLETLFVVTSQNSFELTQLNLRLFEQLLEFLQLKLSVPMKLTLLRFLNKILYRNELAQTHFTKSGGFICLISFLVNMKENQFNSDQSDDDLALLHEISLVLFTALHANPFTQYYFLHKVGLDLFEEGFLLTGVLDQTNTLDFAFGLLFSLIMGDERLITYFKAPEGNESEADVNLNQLLFDTMQSPWFISTLFRFASKLSLVPELELSVLKSLFAVVHSSLRNQILFSQQKVGAHLLTWLNELNGRQSVFNESKQLLNSLLNCLFEFGTNDIDVPKLLAPLNDTETPQLPNLNPLEIVQLGIRSSTIPPLFHFDSQIEAANLIVNNITRPLGFGSNFSTLLWIQIVKFPDADQFPILLIKDDLEKQLYELTINPLRLLTIRGPSGASVSFDGTVLKEEVWYHVVLVQTKVLLSMSSGAVYLYINGRLIDQRKYSYGVSDPSNTTYSVVLGSLCPTGGIFNLASAAVVDEGLDALSVERIFKLGMYYRSTFQDSNRMVTSSSNEPTLHHFRNNSLASIRSKESRHSDSVGTHLPSHFIAEEKLVVAVHPRYLFDTFQTNPPTTIDKPRFVILNLRYKQLKQNLNYYDGVAHPSAHLIVSNHYHLTTQLWKLGGCGMLLQWIDQATSAIQLELSFTILTYAVIGDSNFQTELEHIHGYEVLGYLLKRKAALASPNIIDTLLHLLHLGTGLDHVCLNNLPAFKHLVLDFDIWKLASLPVQQALIGIFTKLVVHNLSAKHNLEIMNGYDTVKRLLFSLKFDQLHRSLLPFIVQVLKLILSSNYNQDNVRLLVAFITTMLRRDVGVKPVSPRFAKSSKTLLDRKSVISDAREAVPPLHHLAVGNCVLEMLLELLQDPTYAIRITSMVTSKWILLLFTTDHNPYAVVLATRILARLFYVNGSAFATKFRVQHEGFVILHKVLPKWWFLPQLYQALIAMLLGVDISNLPIDGKLDFYSLVSLFDQDANSDKEISSETSVILFHMLKHCLTNFHAQSSPSSLDGRMSRTTSVSTLREESSAATICSVSPPTSKDSDRQSQLLQVSQMVQTLLQFFSELFHISKTFRVIVTTHPILEILSAIGFPLSANFIDLMRAPSQFESESIPLTPTSTPISLSGFSSPRLVPSAASFSPTLPATRHRRSMTLPEKYVIETPPLRTEAVEAFLEFLLTLCTTSILESNAKSLVEVEHILQTPFQSDFDAYVKFTNYFLSHLLRHLLSTLQLNPQLLAEPRALVGTVKFSQMLVDLCYQGFFTSGRFLIFEFITSVLERLQQFQASSSEMRFETCFLQMLKFLNRITLYNFTEATSNLLEQRFTVKFLKAFIVNHQFTMHERNVDLSFWKVLMFHLVELLRMDKRHIQINAFNIWKLVLLFKPNEIQLVFKSNDAYQQSLLDSYLKNLEMDLDSFLTWFQPAQPHLLPILHNLLQRPWELLKKQEIRLVGEAINSTHVLLQTRFEGFKSQKEGEVKVYQRVLTILHTWSRNLVNLENESYSKIVQDQNDSNGLVIRLWYQTLQASAANFEKEQDTLRWKLDLTEGPYRMRRRMKPNRHINTTFSYTPKFAKSVLPVESSQTSKVDEDTLVDAELQDTENELGDEDDTSSFVTELDTDSKGYRVLRYLEPNEEILEIFNIGRVTGLDLADSLLLFCKANIYVIDGYFLCQDGNIVESNEIPVDERDVYLQLLTTINKETSTPIVDHQCRKCSYSDLKEVHKRKFLFRNAALEIFFSDGRNLLLTTVLHQREAIYSRFTSKLEATKLPHEMVAGTSSNLDSSSHHGALSSRITNMIFGSSSLTELTTRWERREITNFEYLMYLNTLAGRSYNDLTQYPVFPWILSDYYSSELDLTNPATFRDLSKPMGAQSESRAREFASRFHSFLESEESTPPFHYGTHYSSAMIVCWYLLRLEPFTTHHLKLQGGHFDHPDRLFFSIKEAWLSAAFHNTTDVRELIPEFFYLEEFLTNSNQYQFGIKQESGEPIDDVLLPPWAHNDNRLFVKRHREALECDYVSEHLHQWIDLIFGYKQQGLEAEANLNVFHHLSYQDAVDLDTILDPVEKAATIGIIHNFGQTPKQLFKKPHPRRPRLVGEGFQFDLRKDAHQLRRSYLPILDLGSSPVNDLLQANSKLMALGGKRKFLPRNGYRHIEWDSNDGALRVYQTEPKKLLTSFEESHLGPITLVEPYDEDTLITVGEDNLIRVWNLKFQGKGIPELKLKTTFRGIHGTIPFVTSNLPFGILLVGTSVGEVYLFDLNRLKFLKKVQLLQRKEILAIATDKCAGSVMVCTQASIEVFSVNGSQLAYLPLEKRLAQVRCCFFLEPKPGEFYLTDTFLTGHQDGSLRIWSLTPKSKEINRSQEEGNWNWELNLVHTLHLHSKDCKDFTQAGVHPNSALELEAITLIRVNPTRQVLYLATALGSVYSYQFLDTLEDLHQVQDHYLLPTPSSGLGMGSSSGGRMDGKEVYFRDLAGRCCACLERLKGGELSLNTRVSCTPCGGFICMACRRRNQLCLGGKEVGWVCKKCLKT